MWHFLKAVLIRKFVSLIYYIFLETDVPDSFPTYNAIKLFLLHSQGENSPLKYPKEYVGTFQ